MYINKYYNLKDFLVLSTLSYLLCIIIVVLCSSKQKLMLQYLCIKILDTLAVCSVK